MKKMKIDDMHYMEISLAYTRIDSCTLNKIISEGTKYFVEKSCSFECTNNQKIQFTSAN